MDLDTLKATAQAMVAKGKGILAIDESMPTCKKRFEALGVESTEENRRLYRQLLVTAPGIEEHVSGMILFDETIRQKTDDGTSFVEIFNQKGMIPGIKLDTGAKDLALHPGEKVTEGLDGLRDRIAEYAQIGAKFAKWRAVITIGDNIPSEACIHANAHALARYAALCQEGGLVPMVEPEIIMDGDHSIAECYDVTARTLQALFSEMDEQGVKFEGAVLKVSMVLSGKDNATQADVNEVAEQTIKCLKENVPADLAGVVFLSGGQSNEKSTAHLNRMNQIGGFPWPLSFSYGRAIQSPALKMWAADMNDVDNAQKALVHRAKMNGLASVGEYSEEKEAELATA